MKKFILILTIIISLYSCSKEDVEINNQDIRNRWLICLSLDSVHRITILDNNFIHQRYDTIVFSYDGAYYINPNGDIITTVVGINHQ